MKKAFKALFPVLAGLISILIIMQIFQFTIVNGDSMHPYLSDGDLLITETMKTDPDQTDVIIFKDEDRLLIKRVIGKPGDTIKYSDNKVYVNDKILHEEYVNGETSPGDDIYLNDDEYYVLGDNRKTSIDSRTIGPIKKNQILGIVKYRIYPHPRKI